MNQGISNLSASRGIELSGIVTGNDTARSEKALAESLSLG
jgi:hypothetical protein